MNTRTPAIVSQSAVRRLPRIALILLCVAYVLPGFLGREPWKNADVTAFGVMLEMAAGHSSWWQPQVLGVPAEEAGPLPYWLGAWFIKWLPFLPADMASRLPFGLLLALTLLCTWYAVYQLARQPAAQPVSFAFGGEAQPTDYARALADAGLLALVACLGLAQLSHETTPDLARLAMVAAMLYSAAALAQTEMQGRARTLAVWTLAALALVLSGAPWITAWLGAGLLMGALLARRARAAQLDLSAHGMPDEACSTGHNPVGWAAGLLVLVLLGSAMGGLVPAPQLQTPLNTVNWSNWGRLMLWFTWPAWPLVVWTLWRWRQNWLQPHLALPLWAAAVSVVDSVLSPERDRALLLALPALAALAAFALPTLKRSVSALIDWFTLLFFTGCGLVIWVIWLAMMTGIPAKPAANVARLAPGYVPEFSLFLFAVAAVATGAWIWLVAWRVGKHREAIWKSLVLPASGSTLCWLLLMTLWLPLLDFGRSYGPTSRRIASMVPSQTCVVVHGLSQAQIAGLQYHGGLALQRSTSSLAQTCPILVATPNSQSTLDQHLDLTQWAYKATVRRRGNNREILVVYQRVGSQLAVKNISLSRAHAPDWEVAQ